MLWPLDAEVPRVLGMWRPLSEDWVWQHCSVLGRRWGSKPLAFRRALWSLQDGLGLHPQGGG